MRVLVACEEWGRVRDAFAAKGHDAWSCDLVPSRSPGQHYQCDVREVLGQAWDLLIAHPVCRYLANSGARWLYRSDTRECIQERWELMKKGAEFFNLFLNADHIPMRAIENPIMHGHAQKLVGGKATQYVQPWMFGEPYTKATGLRLIGLPELVATHSKSDYPEIFGECHRMPPGPERESLRSRTYLCVANAMAEQWG